MTNSTYSRQATASIDCIMNEEESIFLKILQMKAEAGKWVATYTLYEGNIIFQMYKCWDDMNLDNIMGGPFGSYSELRIPKDVFDMLFTNISVVDMYKKVTVLYRQLVKGEGDWVTKGKKFRELSPKELILTKYFC